MKVNIVIPAAVMVSVVLFGIVKIRKKELDKEDKQSRFHEIKLRVTGDVLKEYENEKAEMQNLLQKLVSDEKALEDEVNMLISRADEIRGEVDNCQGGQKSAKDELSIAETEFSNLKAEQDQRDEQLEDRSGSSKKDTVRKKLSVQLFEKRITGSKQVVWHQSD
ncbi:hypothetical protein Q5P01_011236 [Channa striata]|uniref:Uncharacterized protein n=1 Tax=Channa striata TaxID=64152 RepID=A0AA88MZ20_CHASR|nr:hypothetical protein Q5P01_011236 [Channa striata]